MQVLVAGFHCSSVLQLSFVCSTTWIHENIVVCHKEVNVIILKIKKCFTSYLNEEGSLCVNFLSTYSSETLLKRFAGDQVAIVSYLFSSHCLSCNR